MPVVPSLISSVAQHSPNSVASRKNPSSCGISMPCSIASIAYCTASGAFAVIFFASASARASVPPVRKRDSPIRCASPLPRKSCRRQAPIRAPRLFRTAAPIAAIRHIPAKFRVSLPADRASHLASDSDRTSQRQFASAAQRKSIDRRDRRLAQRLQYCSTP